MYPNLQRFMARQGQQAPQPQPMPGAQPMPPQGMHPAMAQQGQPGGGPMMMHPGGGQQGFQPQQQIQPARQNPNSRGRFF
jgi:hypothetical protein